MQKILKYAVNEVMELPAGAQILRVGSQEGVSYLWALIQDNAPMVTRKFKIVGTGHQVKPGLDFIATWEDRHFVWHLFEDTSVPAEEPAPVDSGVSSTPSPHEPVTPITDAELTATDPADDLPEPTQEELDAKAEMERRAEESGQ